MSKECTTGSWRVRTTPLGIRQRGSRMEASNTPFTSSGDGIRAVGSSGSFGVGDRTFLRPQSRALEQQLVDASDRLSDQVRLAPVSSWLPPSPKHRERSILSTFPVQR